MVRQPRVQEGLATVWDRFWVSLESLCVFSGDVLGVFQHGSQHPARQGRQGQASLAGPAGWAGLGWLAGSASWTG